VLTTLNAELVPDVTGIVEFYSSVHVSLAPNPLIGSAELNLDGRLFTQNHSVDFYLKDITGRVVKKISRIHSPVTKIFKDELKSGMYFYEVVSSGNSIAKGKLVVE